MFFFSSVFNHIQPCLIPHCYKSPALHISVVLVHVLQSFLRKMPSNARQWISEHFRFISLNLVSPSLTICILFIIALERFSKAFLLTKLIKWFMVSRGTESFIGNGSSLSTWMFAAYRKSLKNSCIPWSPQVFSVMAFKCTAQRIHVALHSCSVHRNSEC